MTVHPEALAAAVRQDWKKCQTCPAMGTICAPHVRPDDPDCTVYHRRMAKIINGMAELAQCHIKPKEEEKIGQNNA